MAANGFARYVLGGCFPLFVVQSKSQILSSVAGPRIDVSQCTRDLVLAGLRVFSDSSQLPCCQSRGYSTSGGRPFGRRAITTLSRTKLRCRHEELRGDSSALRLRDSSLRKGIRSVLVCVQSRRKYTFSRASLVAQELSVNPWLHSCTKKLHFVALESATRETRGNPPRAAIKIEHCEQVFKRSGN